MEEKKFYNFIQEEVLVPILDRLAYHRELSNTARKLNLDKHRLTELKNGRRDLTFYYLNIFVLGGVMTVEDILRKKPMESLTKEERTVVLRLDADPEILELIYAAKKKGLPVKELLNITLGNR
jgi:hypothetical protein